MFILVCNRVVKFNTGNAEKFAPRSSNRVGLYVSGPFSSLRAAQRAALTALGTHTCLDAQVWSESRVRAEAAKGYSILGEVKNDAAQAALRLLDVAPQ